MLELTVFLCGAFVMVLEMTGARVLAPHVGTSAIVWTSLIGVVLACLALGAWAGGRFADKKLSRSGLAESLCGAAAGCAITAFFHTAIGNFVTANIGSLYLGAIIAAIAIFAVPAFFFGMITPYVIRLRLSSIDTAGATVGRLYALSTVGSILGTFLGGFLLISWFSSTAILWSLAIGMLLLSFANYFIKPLARLALLLLFCFLAWQDFAYANWQHENGGPILIESPYNTIRLIFGSDKSRGNAQVRLMATDPGYSQSGMLVDDPDELYFDYTRYYALGPLYKPDAKNVLMLGGGGYSVPKWLLSPKSGLGPNLNVEVVELDPIMTNTAKKYFKLPDKEQLSIVHEDARAFLNKNRKKYDLVFVDVFNSHYSIPFQMGTYEAIKALRNAVAQDGVLVMNLISAVEGEDGRLFRSIWQNLKKEFADVKVYCVSSPHSANETQNLMLVAFAEKKELSPQQNIIYTKNGLSPSFSEIEKMQKKLYKKNIPDDVPPLKDNYAPVERYTLMLPN